MNASGGRARHGIFILLRRLRQPLAALILVYAIAVLGFTLVSGYDPQGRVWRMSFLEAFYFVSFLGTTIGLGEIPHPFSEAQRLWATLSIYGTVTAWLYAIGALFAVLKEPVFRHVRHEGAMERALRRLGEPFYLLCGYDDCGHRVTRELCDDGIQVVVIDKDQGRVEAVDVDGHCMEVPALLGDASDPKTMLLAGLNHPQCMGVLAVTGSDAINTKVALTARLLNPKIPVLCSARDHAWHARMAVAGADHIINPFDTFAQRMGISLRTPSLHVIYEALTMQAATAWEEPPKLPRGRWVLCGWGLFARTLRRELQKLEIETVIVGTELDNSCQSDDCIEGNPTDPAVLRRAQLENAQAIVACTEVDVDNLAIVLMAKSSHKNIFTVARQNQYRNTPIFKAAPIDLPMLSGYVVAGEVLRDVRAPLLSVFLRKARDQDEAWAAQLLARLRQTVGHRVVESWTMTLDPSTMPAACKALVHGQNVSLKDLLTRQDGSDRMIRAVALLLQRGTERQMLPPLDTPVALGDQILFCGRALARTRMRGFAQLGFQYASIRSLRAPGGEMEVS
ncbi:MAG TPA: NAD-binding protein [Burkholderiaceae bacterium]|nr:NAD-binding protein [Burkholderiaceae bacterium]